jgi:amino acid transporter
MGLEVVGKMSIVIGFLSLSPFICMALIGIFKVDPHRWLQLPTTAHDEEENNDDFDAGSIWTAMISGAVMWRPFLNNLFWNLNSFDSTASFAAEVKEPGRTLPRAMMSAIVLIVIGYLIPILIATGATDSTQEDWVDGYLATAAKEIGGEWLGAWVIFAAGAANIALFQAELSADAFQLMGMAERGYLPKLFATRSRFGTPTYGIMLGVAVIVAMGSFNLDKLIEMLNFNYAIALLLEYAAFVKLRISKPDGEHACP